MAAQVEVRDEIQLPRVVDHGHGIADPLVDCLVAEGTAAHPVAVHLRPQDGEAGLIGGPHDAQEMVLLHVAGEAVDENQQRHFFRALPSPGKPCFREPVFCMRRGHLRQVQLAVDGDPVILQIEFSVFHRYS